MSNQKLAHDLMQPLTTLRAFVRHMETKKADPEFMTDFFIYVPKALDRIEEIAKLLSSSERS